MRLAKNKMYIGWLLIVTILLMLFGCNEGGNNTVMPSNLKAITAFSFPSANGPINATIIGQNITVTMPFGTNVTDLIATFTTTGKSVSVNGVQQVSGVTPINFTNPVSYIVTAADGSTATYVVTITVAASPAKAITSYSLNGTAGTINGQNIAVTMPFGTDLSALIATFTTTGQSVKIGSTIQVSGTTPNNFTNPVAYIVTATDGSTATYVVTVTVPKTLFSCISDPVTSKSCGCLLQNDGSGLIWYADGSQIGTWTNWCSHTGPAADINCSSDGSSLVVFNNAHHCGYSDWHLPTAPNSSSPSYVYQIGGNWGSIGTYAKNNGWTQTNTFYTWLNVISGTNHFNNVANSFYWSSQSYDSFIAFGVEMGSGVIQYDEIVSRVYNSILLVHSGQ